MSERKEPSNSVAEIMRMCEDADLKDLIIIVDQFDQEKHLYKKKDANDILLFISARRKKLEIDPKWNSLKEKLGL